jgi:hypothetical protein
LEAFRSAAVCEIFADYDATTIDGGMDREHLGRRDGLRWLATTGGSHC